MAKVKRDALVLVRYMIPVDNLFAKDGERVIQRTFEAAGLHLSVTDDSIGLDYHDSAILVQYDSLSQALNMDSVVRGVIESIKWSRIKQLPEWKGRV